VGAAVDYILAATAEVECLRCELSALEQMLERKTSEALKWQNASAVVTKECDAYSERVKELERQLCEGRAEIEVVTAALREAESSVKLNQSEKMECERLRAQLLKSDAESRELNHKFARLQQTLEEESAEQTRLCAIVTSEQEQRKQLEQMCAQQEQAREQQRNAERAIETEVAIDCADAEHTLQQQLEAAISERDHGRTELTHVQMQLGEDLKMQIDLRNYDIVDMSYI